MREKKLKIDNFSKEEKKEMGFSFKDWNYEGSKVSRKRNRNPRGAKFVWKEDWSWFKHTHENRFDSIKNQTMRKEINLLYTLLEEKLGIKVKIK